MLPVDPFVRTPPLGFDALHWVKLRWPLRNSTTDVLRRTLIRFRHPRRMSPQRCRSAAAVPSRPATVRPSTPVAISSVAE